MEKSKSSEPRYYWQKVVGEERLKIDLEKLRNIVKDVFKSESDNYKQKLVYNLLETVKNNDQKTFFYTLLRAINKPEKKFIELCKVLKEYYDVMPEETFINFGYSVIIGIMSTYEGIKSEKEGEENE